MGARGWECVCVHACGRVRGFRFAETACGLGLLAVSAQAVSATQAHNNVSLPANDNLCRRSDFFTRRELRLGHLRELRHFGEYASALCNNLVRGILLYVMHNRTK